MDIGVLMLVFTSLLREGIPLFSDLIYSQNLLTWNASINYCEKMNSSLIQLDSQEKWDYFITHAELKGFKGLKGLQAWVPELWTGLRFDDTVQCDTANQWMYDGWARWSERYSEPNGCPAERCTCASLVEDEMLTVPCSFECIAVCEIESGNPDSSTSIPTTPDPISAPTTELVKHDWSVTPKDDPEAGESSTEPNNTSTIEATDATSASNIKIPEESSVLTTATLIYSTTKNVTCGKCCVKKPNTKEVDQDELDEIKQMLRVQLAVNKTNLSAHRRKLTSVYDSRPSSVAMGGVACAVLAAVVGVIVVPDMITLGRFLYKRY